LIIDQPFCQRQPNHFAQADQKPYFPSSIYLLQVSGQGDATALLVGDWFTYALDMDLPSIATNKKVEVEICTNPPDNGDPDNSEPGRTSLAIGNSSVIAIGDHFQGIWWQDEKEWLDVGGNQVK
jgi:hypothetical protein